MQQSEGSTFRIKQSDVKSPAAASLDAFDYTPTAVKVSLDFRHFCLIALFYQYVKVLHLSLEVFTSKMTRCLNFYSFFNSYLPSFPPFCACAAYIRSNQIMGWGEKAIEIRSVETGHLDGVFMHKRAQRLKFLCERNDKVKTSFLSSSLPFLSIQWR